MMDLQSVITGLLLAYGVWLFIEYKLNRIRLQDHAARGVQVNAWGLRANAAESRR
jgi:hypothetical protein